MTSLYENYLVYLVFIIFNMQFEIEYEYFNKVIVSYMEVMHVGNLKTEIEQLSNEIIKVSKKVNFVEMAFRFLMTNPYEKQRFVLVSTLLKDKFKYDFEIIEKEKLLDIYKKLCEIAYLIGTKSFAFYTNIALALAYIYIQISANSEQKLQIFLAPFIPKENHQSTLYNYYFKILQYVASQVYNKKLVIDEEYRETIRNRLILQQYRILIHFNELVPTIWDNPQIEKSNIIECFVEWIIIDCNVDIMNHLPNHFIINKIFQEIFNDRRTEEMAKSLKEIVHILKVPKETPALYEYLGKKMIELLANLKAIELDDQYEAQEYLNIIIDFCCKSVEIFVANFDDSIANFLAKIIEYSKDEYLDVYDHVIFFWQQFLGQVENQRSKITINPAIYSLISDMYDACCSKCNYSIDFIKKLNTMPEEKIHEVSQAGQDIFKKRQNSEEIFQLMAKVIGKKDFIIFVFNKIKEITRKQEKIMWPYLQIYLFSLIHALKAMEHYVPQIETIIQIYQELSANKDVSIPIIVKRTFLKIMRSLMSMKEKNPILIQNLFIYSISSLEQKLLEDTANKNLEIGCKHNHELLISLGKAPELLTLVQKYPNREQIIRGIIYLIKPYQNLSHQYLFHILKYLSDQLAQHDSNKSMRKHFISSITGIMKVLNDSPEKQKYTAIILAWIKAIWPYIIKNLTSPRALEGDEDVEVQRIVKLLKLVLRCLKFQFAELIESLYSNMLSAFKVYPICSYAYLIEIAITVYYENPQYTEYFKNVYITFCEHISDHLAKVSTYEGYSYLLDDFIGMNKRFFIYNANILLNSGKFPYIIDLCIKTFVGCETPRIAKASYDFFQSIFMIYWRKQFIDEFNQRNPKKQPFKIKSEDQSLYLQLKKFFSDRLEFIIGKILEHLYKVPSETTINYIIDVLIAQLYGFPEQNLLVWPKLLQMLPLDILVSNEKYRFMQYLNKFCDKDFAVSKDASEKLKEFIFLIKNRMVYSNKRKKALM